MNPEKVTEHILISLEYLHEHLNTLPAESRSAETLRILEDCELGSLIKEQMVKLIESKNVHEESLLNAAMVRLFMIDGVCNEEEKEYMLSRIGSQSDCP